MHTRAWRGGDVVATDFPIAQVSEHLDHEDEFVWIDLCAPDQETLHEVARELGIHELAIEDASSEHQRPKLDRYPTHSFLSCHALRWAGNHAGRIAETEIDCILGKRWLVTVRHDDGFTIEPVIQRWEDSAQLLSCGVKFLLYGLLDVVVDGYFDAVTHFDEYYDEVSDGLFADEPLDPRQQRDWFETRRSLVRFHRLVAPMREVVSGIMRRDETTLEEPIYPYYQDLYDHVLRIIEATDAVRDLMATIVETNLSLRDYRQNIIMKKVTSWAAIIAVPTLVTGWYGMNVPYPGFARHWGVWMSLVIMVVAAGALYGMFRRKEWI